LIAYAECQECLLAITLFRMEQEAVR